MKNFCRVLLTGALLGIVGSNVYGQLPERWIYQPEHAQTVPSADGWWRQYADPTLDSLIVRAEANNSNVAHALKRIKIAQRQITAARASLYPTLDLAAGWSRSESAGAISRPATASHSESYFNLGANVNWEIDIFGRVASKVKSAKAGVAVSSAEYDAVMVALCADVASAYFQLRTYQQQYQVALDHIASQEKVVNMTKVRYEAGLANALEVSQAKTVLYSTQASLPSLESAIASTVNSLAVLIGEYPSENLSRMLAESTLPPAPPLLTPADAPSELLRRRPDVVEAEKELAQYAAQVGVSKKDFLPVLALSGSVGTASHALQGLFGKNSLDYSVGATLSWTVFDGFARSNNLAEARLNLEAAIDDYNLTMQTAVEEVNSAISTYNASLTHVLRLKDVVEESQRSYELSVEQYKEGLSDFINVVNSQLTFLENQSALAEANGNVYAAQVALYKAFGGGIIQ